VNRCIPRHTHVCGETLPAKYLVLLVPDVAATVLSASAFATTYYVPGVAVEGIVTDVLTGAEVAPAARGGTIRCPKAVSEGSRVELVDQ